MSDQNDEKFIVARQKLRDSYTHLNSQRNKKKIIVLTTPHIENDIAFRKRRACK